MSLYSTETQPNAMGGKAENGPETISDPEVKKYTGNKEITSWCYLFIHHAKVETVSKKLQTEQYRIFVHKSIVYKRGNKLYKNCRIAWPAFILNNNGDYEWNWRSMTRIVTGNSDKVSI